MKKTTYLVNAFAVKVENAFWAPMVGDVKDIVKNFTFAINDTNSPLFGKEAVTDLYHIGTYNCGNGRLKSIAAQLVVKGEKVKLPVPLNKEVENA